MTFRPTFEYRLRINGGQFRFEPNPVVASFVYAQKGRKGTVYQIANENTGEKYALKVFHPSFRTPEVEQSVQTGKRFLRLSGLRVLERQVLNAQTQPMLIEQYPDLAYSVLMPWIDGDTWCDIVSSQHSLQYEQSRLLAARMAHVLSGLEDKGLAHCDVAGSNSIVLIDAGNVELVDVEDLFGPGLRQPQALPAGTDGYAFKNVSATGLWSAEADRFAGAIILTEMLIWGDALVRSARDDMSFFSQAEIGQKSDRFSLARQTLLQTSSKEVADAFETAWFANTLSECPTLRDWWHLTKIFDTPSVGIEDTDVGRPIFEVTPPPLSPAVQPRRPHIPFFKPTRIELAALLTGLPLLALMFLGTLTSTLIRDPFLAAIWNNVPLLALVAPVFHAAFRKRWIVLAGYLPTAFVGGIIQSAVAGTLSAASFAALCVGIVTSGALMELLVQLTDTLRNAGLNRQRDLVFLAVIGAIGTLVMYQVAFGNISIGVWFTAPILGALGWIVGDRINQSFLVRRELHRTRNTIAGNGRAHLMIANRSLSVVCKANGIILLGRRGRQVSPDIDLSAYASNPKRIHRRHVEIKFDGRNWQMRAVHNPDAQNGTWLNGRRLTEQQWYDLQANDVVRCGPVEFMFQEAI